MNGNRIQGSDAFWLREARLVHFVQVKRSKIWLLLVTSDFGGWPAMEYKNMQEWILKGLLPRFKRTKTLLLCRRCLCTFLNALRFLHTLLHNCASWFVLFIFANYGFFLSFFFLMVPFCCRYLYMFGIFVPDSLNACLNDYRYQSFSAGGDIKAITSKRQLSDMIKVLLCPSSYMNPWPSPCMLLDQVHTSMLPIIPIPCFFIAIRPRLVLWSIFTEKHLWPCSEPVCPTMSWPPHLSLRVYVLRFIR